MRTNGTDSDFTFQLNYKDQDAFDYAVVLQISIPKSYWLVQTSSNTFILNENGNQTNVIIPVGNYGRSSFKTQLQTSLNSASFNAWTYTVTVPNSSSTADTGFFTFTVTGNGSIQPQFIIGTSLFEQLGLNKNTTYTFSANSLVSVNVVKFQLEDTLYLHSDLVSNGVDNILQEVFGGDSPNFANLVWICPSVEAYAKPISSNSNNSYRFYLCDEDGEKIDTNGQNLVFSLMLFKKENVYSMIKQFLKIKLME